jgi:hypothetical protein
MQYSKPMATITTILSMLHEPAGAGSAKRLFRGKPVLDWTLARLRRSATLSTIVILCWDDQAEAVMPVASARGAVIASRGIRQPIPQLNAISAARRWSDGWRGGLGGTCEFDRGFFAPWADEVRRQTDAEAVLLVDPAAGLVDSTLIDSLLAHAESQPEIDLCFSPVAPGLSGVLLRKTLLEQLAASKLHAGIMLGYRPDVPRRDPISTEACAPHPTPLARTTHRFTLDSERQLSRAALATQSLNGQLIAADAESLLGLFNANRCSDAMPREIVLELTTTRATRPIYCAATHLKIDRPSLNVATAQKLFAELGEVDDLRLTLAGVGDPMLHDGVLDVIAAAKAAGIPAVGLETDLVGVDPARVAALADSGVDVVSVHIPAASQVTYAAVMGVDALQEVVNNLKTFVERRQASGRGVPLLVPMFTKCPQNLTEMEPWYDHWIRTLNSAVIVGPSDFCGQIPDSAVADMAPPRRRPCARIAQRLTVLSNGRAVTCEQDVLGQQTLGDVTTHSIKEIWDRMTTVRAQHSAGRWDAYPLCGACREWHR